MILFLFVYGHVTSRFIRRSRAETNLDIDAQKPFPGLEKVRLFFINLSIYSCSSYNYYKYISDIIENKIVINESGWNT